MVRNIRNLYSLLTPLLPPTPSLLSVTLGGELVFLFKKQYIKQVKGQGEERDKNVEEGKVEIKQTFKYQMN